MTTEMEANSLVRGLVFACQKTRSNLREGLGADGSPDGIIVDALLKDMHPLLFGEGNILSRLLEWQARMEKSGIIAGSDLFNIVKYIDMSDSRVLLGLLGVYGYPTIPDEGPPLSWFTQSWRYLTA